MFVRAIVIVTVADSPSSSWKPLEESSAPSDVVYVIKSETAETVAVRPDYVVRLINPDSAFHIVRNENQYGLQPVAPSIDELRGNKSSYFARAYTALGLLQDCGWATIDFTGLCVGGRVNSTATCIA